MGIELADRAILIIGAGGAVAGLLGPLLERDPGRVFVVNRTGERAERLAEKFAHRGPVAGDGFDALAAAGGFDLLIQSTSAGHDRDLPPLQPDWLRDGAPVYDLNYGPAHEPLADWCGEHGVTTCDGLGMLVGQAALAFEIWTGRRPSMEPVLETLRAG